MVMAYTEQSRTREPRTAPAVASRRRKLRTNSPEPRIHIRVIRSEPVAEAAANQLACRRRRRTLHHVMLAVKKIRRVLRVRCHCRKARKRTKDRGSPLPSIADQVLHAP